MYINFKNMSLTRCVLVILVLYFYLLYCAASKSKKQAFEAVLENAKECKDPSPPYSKKLSLLAKYQINVINGRRLLSGNSMIIAPIPFQNFSGRTFAIDKSGKRQIKMQLSEVSCKNIFVKTLIGFVNVSISATCMIQKGNFRYDNLDLNKIMHALPVFHAPGDVLHQLQLVSDGATEFCTDIFVKII